jgi:hypothetical protein
MSGTVCCKRCQGEEVVKSGRIRNKQRWLCKACGLNFVEGEGRPGPSQLVLRKRAWPCSWFVWDSVSERQAWWLVWSETRSWNGFEIGPAAWNCPRWKHLWMWWNLTKCTILSNQKKQVLDLESNNDSCWYNSTRRCRSGGS